MKIFRRMKLGGALRRLRSRIFGVPRRSHGVARAGRSFVHAGCRSPADSAQVSATAARRQSMNGEPERRGASAMAAAVSSGNRWIQSANARNRVQSGSWLPCPSVDHARWRSARRSMAIGSGLVVVSERPSARSRRVRVSQRGCSCPCSIFETVGYETSASRANSRVEMPSESRAWRIHKPGCVIVSTSPLMVLV